MDVRGHIVNQEQEGKTAQQADDGRDNAARPLSHFQRRDQQRPNRSRHHHAGSEAHQDFLDQGRHLLFHKKDEGRAKGRTQERNQKRCQDGVHG